MIRDIFDTIRQYGMIEPGMRVIAGVSGGADSVCLLYVLDEYRREVPFELSAVHVEHGLRGAESLEDAAFVEELCSKRGIPCRVIHSDVRRIAEEQGLSLEEAGRRERYRIFGEQARDAGADRIAVAHSRNDQAETVLMNLVRGSGLFGLAGIRPVRDRIIRPLLFTNRSEIEEILRGAGLSWRTDQSNFEKDFTRNRVRLEILPMMERELNSRASEHIAQSAERLREVQTYLDKQTDSASAACLRQDGRGVLLLLAPFEREDPLIQKELLLRALDLTAAGADTQPESGRKDIGQVHLEMLRDLAGMDCGKSVDLPGKIRASREEGVLRFAPRREEAAKESSPLPLSLPVPGEVRLRQIKVCTELAAYDPGMEEQIREEKKYTKWFSYDTINSNLQLRTRQSGDYLVVNSEGGKKKLKEYLIEMKIPRERRDELLLLADGSHILWVLGYRISEAAKVTEKTRQLLKVTVSGLVKEDRLREGPT